MRYASLCSKACRFSIWFSCSCFVYKDLKAGAFAISRYFSWLEDIYKDLPHLDQKGYLWQQLIQVFAYLFPSLSKSLYKKKGLSTPHLWYTCSPGNKRGKKKKKQTPYAYLLINWKYKNSFISRCKKRRYLTYICFYSKASAVQKFPALNVWSTCEPRVGWERLKRNV